MYYLNPKTANKRVVKAWKKTMRRVAVVADHVFYEDR